VVTVSQLGLIGAAFAVGPNPVCDWGLAVLLPLHTYWGIEQVIHDYVPEVMRSFYKTGSAPETARKIVHWLWVGTSLLTFAGLCYVNIYDVGLCKAVQILWTKL
jgi:succinate dehydrogenase (ubiquinone) membrane anchor subunit